MKTWMVALASVVFGVLMGCGVTWYEFHNVPEIYVTATSLKSDPASQAKPAPKARVAGGTTHEFGTMQLGTKKRHEFVISNEGSAPLLLSKTGTPPTCKCTEFDVPTEPIAPGESAKVLLEWKPDSFSLEFTQSADVRTNDPQRELIPLTIKGSVVEFARASPSEVSFSDIPSNEERTAQTRVLSYLSDELKVKSFELVNQETAQLFDVTWEPLPAKDVAQERRVRSGLIITVKTKPGLPLGSIDQTIRLAFEGAESISIDVPIRGTVGSDVAIFGPSSFGKESQTLRLGVVKGSQGIKTELRVIVKGPHRDETTLSVASIEPDNVLKVSIGKPTPTPNGKAVVHVVTVEIPPGSPAINRIGSELIKPGRIVIDTTHPEVKQLLIAVNFAVEE